MLRSSSNQVCSLTMLGWDSLEWIRISRSARRLMNVKRQLLERKTHTRVLIGMLFPMP